MTTGAISLKELQKSKTLKRLMAIVEELTGVLSQARSSYATVQKLESLIALGRNSIVQNYIEQGAVDL